MIRSWLSSPSQRLFPHSPVQPNRAYSYDAALNERFSFQVGIRDDHEDLSKAPWFTEVTCQVDAPKGWQTRVRRVGQVPVNHRNTLTPAEEIDGVDNYPGFVPDPLFDETLLKLPPAETQSFFITIVPAKRVKPGAYQIDVKLVDKEDKKISSHKARITLHDVSIKARRNFPVVQWTYADQIIDWYKTDLFDERFYKIMEAYFRNMAEHGQDCAYVPVFTPPLDGVKRPSQLLRVMRTGTDKYEFDWADVRRYVRLMKSCGLKYFEWTHLFTQWGVRHAIRVYDGQGHSESLLWPAETEATSDTYRKFLAQFLPELKKFCEEEKILKKSFFHVSDEPHGAEARANYIKARTMLKELAPWMKVMDAISEIEYGRDALTDTPIPSISTAVQFHDEGIKSWCYFCCSPRGRFLNRLLDTPLAKIRMSGWLFYRWAFGGFLHWGYNYWAKCQTRELIDPFTVQDGLRWPSWAYGDTFVVYPGPDGPIDSLRWEAFADSLQDYALLQTLGVDNNDKMLAALKSFEDFPKTENWRLNARKKLFAALKQAK